MAVNNFEAKLTKIYGRDCEINQKNSQIHTFLLSICVFISLKHA